MKTTVDRFARLGGTLATSTTDAQGNIVIRIAAAPDSPDQNANINGIEALTSRQLRTHCRLDEAATEMLKMATTELNLSARAYDRVLKVARTIADLDASEHIQAQHLGEAVQYRALDRGG